MAVQFIQPGRFGAAAAFSPSDLAGLKAWYDASDAATITSSGGAVSQWNDKSGNGLHLSQGTAANRPTTGSATRNSLNVLSFDGSDDNLVASTASDWNFTHQGPTFTIFAVVFVSNASNTTNINTVCSTVGFVRSGIQFSCDNRTGSSRTDRLTVVGYNESQQETLLHESNNEFPVGSWHIFAITCDPDNATAANRITTRRNGSTLSLTNPRTNAPSSAANARTPLNVGSQGAPSVAPVNPLKGEIGELIFYEASLTAENISQVETYLNTKWAVY